MDRQSRGYCKMESVSANAFEQNYQSHLKHLKHKGLQPKTIDAYARAIRRIGARSGQRIDDLTEQQLTDQSVIALVDLPAPRGCAAEPSAIPRGKGREGAFAVATAALRERQGRVASPHTLLDATARTDRERPLDKHFGRFCI
jgi:hypothetical protein